MNSKNIILLDEELHSDKPGAENLRRGIKHITFGNFLSAEKELKTAYEIHQQRLPPEHPVIAEDLTQLGVAYWNLDKITFAHKCFYDAIVIDKMNFSPTHKKVVRNINNLGLINKSQGKISKAIWLFDRALMLSRRENPDMTGILVNLSLALKADNRYKEAQMHLQKAIKIDVASEAELKVARDLLYLAYIQIGQENPEKVIGLLQKALEIYEKNDQRYKIAYCLAYMGDAVQDDLKLKKAYYSKALEIFRELLDDNHPNIKLLEKRMMGQ